MNKTWIYVSQKTLNICLFLAMILLPRVAAEGQETKVIRDLRLWTGVKAEKQLSGDLTLSLGGEFRFRHDISEISNYFTEAELHYRISKNFALEGQYRFTRDRKKDLRYENLSRYALDLRYKGRLDFLSVRYRLRYQKEVEGMRIFDMEIPYEKYLRHRLTLRYEDLNRIRPYASAEIFQVFRKGEDARFEYIRILGGVKYQMDKAGEINLAYGFNREILTPQAATIYLIRINYTYAF
jgi:hypothetical protein